MAGVRNGQYGQRAEAEIPNADDWSPFGSEDWEKRRSWYKSTSIPVDRAADSKWIIWGLSFRGCHVRKTKRSTEQCQDHQFGMVCNKLLQFRFCQKSVFSGICYMLQNAGKLWKILENAENLAVSWKCWKMLRNVGEWLKIQQICDFVENAWKCWKSSKMLENLSKM